MLPGEIERLLGWHLLVPARIGQRVFLSGFPKGAVESWRELRVEPIVSDINQADIVIAFEHSRSHRAALTSGSKGWVAIGRGWFVSRPDAMVYGLVPPNNPRIVLPLDDRAQTLRGLRMHRPGRWSARLAVWLLELSVRLGFVWPLKRRCLWVSIRSSEPLEANEDKISPSSVLYLGTIDENRKTTILPPDKLKIVKHGTSTAARIALLNEATALKALEGTILAGRVPKFISFKSTGKYCRLSQEYRDSKGTSALKWRSAVENFLDDLAKIDQKECYDIPGHRCHGDFAPWNMKMTDEGLFVFDWEESRAWAPALWDAFYYSTARYLCMQNSGDPVRTVEEALAFAKRCAERQGLDAKWIPQLWRMWLDHVAKRHPGSRIDAMVQYCRDLA